MIEKRVSGEMAMYEKDIKKMVVFYFRIDNSTHICSTPVPCSVIAIFSSIHFPLNTCMATSNLTMHHTTTVFRYADIQLCISLKSITLYNSHP